MTGSTCDGFEAACAGLIALRPLTCDAPIAEQQGDLRAQFASELYGEIPQPPDSINVSRQPLPGERAERLVIELAFDKRRFTVDAALWLPEKTGRPSPLICGLDFVGPVGIMTSTAFPIDAHARISPRPKYGAPDKRLTETLRGTSAFRWPVGMLQDAGYAVLVSCYGSWVPDDVENWKTHGLYPLLDCGAGPQTGAITLWAWAIQRLLDVAEGCTEIDSTRMTVAGHSRLGKAALWAASNDTRIRAVFANQSGCGGAAPAAHPVGETFAQMAARFPHWTIPGSNLMERAFDQHQLLAQIAPRAVYLGGAQGDLWSDPIGSFAALEAAARFWQTEKMPNWIWPSAPEIWKSCGQVRNGPLGYHLRPGEHDLLPYDWRQFLNFLQTA